MIAAQGKDWFGHPRGLTILFLTDVWEQFSFYGMRALLVYYMINKLQIPQQRASIIYGVYVATVFLTPLVGGLIADRWLGRKASVILGSLIMATGHFMMTFENMLYPALAAIATGSGLFASSLPAQINDLYSAEDPRRRSAYVIYYVGINLGGVLAPLVVGTVGELYGWHLGFGIAGVGMIAALAIYLTGTRYLPNQIPARRIPKVARQTPKVPLDKPVVERLLLLFGIAGCVVLFRGAYEQSGNTIVLWLEQGVDRHITAHWSIPMTWFQALNPLVVMIGAPLLASRWTRLSLARREPGSITKMVTGATLVAISYLLLSTLIAWASHYGRLTDWIWATAFLLLMTLGELYILPVGLGLFGRLAPIRLTATSIGIWFLAGFFGNLLAGWLGGYWGMFSHALFFSVVAAFAFSSGILLLMFARWTNRAESTS